MIADGRTIYACSTLAIEAQGKKIRTVEGFTHGTVLHPVQQAFCDNDGLMCGFCTPGFVTSDGRAPREESEADAPNRRKRALDGNICRCGTYIRVLEAALAMPGAAVEAQRRWEPPRAGDRTAGRPAAQTPTSPAAARRRTAGPPHPGRPSPNGARSASRSSASTARTRSQGKAKYTYDIIRPGMLYGRILGSPHAHARVEDDRSVRRAEDARRARRRS